MPTMYHGRQAPGFTLHAGICFTSTRAAALSYGPFLTTVVIGDVGEIQDIGTDYDPNGGFPCDTATERATAIQAGFDAVTYGDMGWDACGAHDCLRLLTPAAIQAVGVIETDTNTEEE